MGTLYIDTGGSTLNSGSTDEAVAPLSGLNNATVSGSTVTLPAGTDLSAVVTAAGPTQSSINLNSATNSNRKIFWITAKAGSGGATPTVDVDVAPTGIGGTTTWAIGGQHVLTNASIEGATRAGDEVVFNNSPSGASGTRWQFRTAGDSTSGFTKIRGKTGTRPVLNTTNTASCVASSVAYAWIENLELDQDGASGVAISFASSVGHVVNNVKISDAGGGGITGLRSGRILNSEITGTGAAGILAGGADPGSVQGCYIHDLASDGISSSVTAPTCDISFNIIDTCAGRGILLSGTINAATSHFTNIRNNTIYGCGDSGLEITDQDAEINLFNNIFQDNGDAAGEYNVEWVAGAAEMISIHMNNCFNKASNNLFGLTANATEITSDPLFTDAANGDFSLQSSSPCKATGSPGQFLGSSSVGYPDMGAVQRQEAASGGGSSRLIGGGLIAA